MAERDDRLRPGRLLLLGALLAAVFLLLLVLVAARFGPELVAAVREFAVGALRALGGVLDVGIRAGISV